MTFGMHAKSRDPQDIHKYHAPSSVDGQNKKIKSYVRIVSNNTSAWLQLQQPVQRWHQYFVHSETEGFLIELMAAI